MKCPRCEAKKAGNRKWYANLTPEQKRARRDKGNAARRLRYAKAKAARESDDEMDRKASEWLKRTA